MKLISKQVEAFGLTLSFYSKNPMFSSFSWESVREDIAKVAYLDDLFFPFPWSEKAWFDLDEGAEDYALFILKEGPSTIVAFSLWKLSQLDGLAHLLKVMVVRDWRGRGLGTSFLDSSIEFFGRNGFLNFYLEVEETNISAWRSYESLGFERLHKALNYYGASRNAIKMGKILE